MWIYRDKLGQNKPTRSMLADNKWPYNVQLKIITIQKMQNLDKSRDFIPVNIAVLTVSDTRSDKDDKSGNYLRENIIKTGHYCKLKKIVRDEVDMIKEILEQWVKRQIY